MGVVYGDIGTSPIYAFRESLHASHGLAASGQNVLGVLSLIFWSLIVVISVKYLGLVMRADNRGEGGVIALTALISPPSEQATGRRRIFARLGLFGAALLYRDSVITPAISVLSAVEGLEVEHTSAKRLGQIYLPAVNWALMIGCVGLVLGFGTSSDLAAACGVAVTTDMVFTTLLFALVARGRFEWSLWIVGFMAAVLLSVDLSFWAANLPKIPDGGWFPLVVAGVIFVLMTTWKRGRRILGKRLEGQVVPTDEFFEKIAEVDAERIPGTAVFMDSNPEGTPPALIHNLEHNRVLHEQVVILTVVTREVPRLQEEEDRLAVRELREGSGLYRATAYFGFAEDPNVPALLARSAVGGEGFELGDTTYFLGRETLLATDRPGMAIWRERLFVLMSRNAERAARYFHIPSDRVVELGTQVEL